MARVDTREIQTPGLSGVTATSSPVRLRVMENEFLDADDYASVHRAVRLLSGGRSGAPTLNGRTEAWAQLVADVEQGLNTTWAVEFDNDIACRDWLHEAWPILTERVRRIRQPELDALDDRFRAATAPMLGMDEDSVAQQERWWRYRYPLRVTGNPAERLPPAWCPPPAHVG
jgi:hypothetical protein